MNHGIKEKSLPEGTFGKTENNVLQSKLQRCGVYFLQHLIAERAMILILDPLLHHIFYIVLLSMIFQFSKILERSIQELNDEKNIFIPERLIL